MPTRKTADATTFIITTPNGSETTSGAMTKSASNRIRRMRCRQRYSRVAIGARLRSAVETVEVFDPGPGIENDHPFALVDLAGGAKRFERGKAGGTLWR